MDLWDRIKAPIHYNMTAIDNIALTKTGLRHEATQKEPAHQWDAAPQQEGNISQQQRKQHDPNSNNNKPSKQQYDPPVQEQTIEMNPNQKVNTTLHQGNGNNLNTQGQCQRQVNIYLRDKNNNSHLGQFTEVGGDDTSRAADENEFEQLNTIFEALFNQDRGGCQDVWGCQQVNQDSSWDSYIISDVPGAPEPYIRVDVVAPQACKQKINNGTQWWDPISRPPPSEYFRDPTTSQFRIAIQSDSQDSAGDQECLDSDSNNWTDAGNISQQQRKQHDPNSNNNKPSKQQYDPPVQEQKIEMNPNQKVNTTLHLGNGNNLNTQGQCQRQVNIYLRDKNNNSHLGQFTEVGGDDTSRAADENEFEQLNTIFEALFNQDRGGCQDVWGCQQVNQDSSWDSYIISDVPGAPEPYIRVDVVAPQACKQKINNGTQWWDPIFRPPPSEYFRDPTTSQFRIAIQSDIQDSAGDQECLDSNNWADVGMPMLQY